jgi:hypothetical protein
MATMNDPYRCTVLFYLELDRRRDVLVAGTVNMTDFVSPPRWCGVAESLGRGLVWCGTWLQARAGSDLHRSSRAQILVAVVEIHG